MGNLLPVLGQDMIKPVFEEALLSILYSKDVRKRARERQRQREIGSSQGDHLGTFL